MIDLNVKLCPDCRYNSDQDCLHTEAMASLNVTTGELRFKHKLIMRDYSGVCGREAKLFEAVPSPKTAWQKIKFWK